MLRFMIALFMEQDTRRSGSIFGTKGAQRPRSERYASCTQMNCRLTSDLIGLCPKAHDRMIKTPRVDEMRGTGMTTMLTAEEGALQYSSLLTIARWSRVAYIPPSVARGSMSL